MNMWGWSEKRLLLLVFVSYAVFVVNSSTLSLGRCRQAVQSCHLYSFVAQVLVQICQVNVGCTDCLVQAWTILMENSEFMDFTLFIQKSSCSFVVVLL